MKLDDFLSKYIVQYSGTLNSKMSDLRYTLSNNIMYLEVKLGITQKETSNMCNISLDTLLKMESVDLTIPVSTYINSILILNKQYINKIKLNTEKSNNENNRV